MAAPTVWRISSDVGVFPEDCLRKLFHHNTSRGNHLPGSAARCSLDDTTLPDVEPVDVGGLLRRVLDFASGF